MGSRKSKKQNAVQVENEDPVDRVAIVPATVTDNSLLQYLGYVTKRVYLAIQADAERTLEGFGLRITTSSALHIIIENPNLSQSQLAQALSIERSRAVILVDNLERDDLISRNKVPGDRRSYALCATPKGINLRQKVEKALLQHEERLFGALDGEERDHLKKLLTKVAAAETS